MIYRASPENPVAHPRGSRSADRRRWSRWMNAWTGLSLPGVGFAVLVWGPMTVVAIAAIVALLVAMVVGMIEYHPWSEGTRSQTRLGPWTGRIALCAVALVVSTLTWTAISPDAILFGMLAGVTTPSAVDLVQRVLAPAAKERIASTGIQPETVELLTARHVSLRLAEAAQAMSDQQLCRAWRQSLWTLGVSSTAVEQLAVVLQRQSFLDEMEARHDTALREWLASGARASGGPERFLT